MLYPATRQRPLKNAQDTTMVAGVTGIKGSFGKEAGVGAEGLEKEAGVGEEGE